MITIKRIFINGFFIITIYLVVITSIIAINEMNQVAADAPNVSTTEMAAPAENTLSNRDITQQQFAPTTTNEPFQPYQPTN
ncbi:MAG: hypothetical protein KDJ52_09395 [Anaerolineae bacterium]|nr:hypothetical protein [Anaerolineae bacterium]